MLRTGITTITSCWILFLLTPCLSIPVQKNFLCKPSSTSHCYYIYRNNSTNINWDGANRFCKHEQFTLASIPDYGIQNLIVSLLKASGLVDERVWIGGRKSNDTTWRTLDGSLFTDFHSIDKDTNAGVLRKTHSGNIKIITTDKIFRGHPLCQINRFDGDCKNEVAIRNLCYTLLPERVTWFSATRLCEQYAPGSSLAFTDIDTQEFADGMASSPYIPNDTSSWLGVYRQPWHWSDKPKEVMRYDNWDQSATYNLLVDEQHCAMIQSNLGYNWLSMPCGSSRVRYFICEQTPDNAAHPLTISTNLSVSIGISVCVIVVVVGTLLAVIIYKRRNRSCITFVNIGDKRRSRFRANRVVTELIVRTPTPTQPTLSDADKPDHNDTFANEKYLTVTGSTRPMLEDIELNMDQSQENICSHEYLEILASSETPYEIMQSPAPEYQNVQKEDCEISESRSPEISYEEMQQPPTPEYQNVGK